MTDKIIKCPMCGKECIWNQWKEYWICRDHGIIYESMMDNPKLEPPVTKEQVLQLLRDLEWSGSHTDYEDSWGVMTYACPCCFNAKEDGHKEDCKLSYILRKGIR